MLGLGVGVPVDGGGAAGGAASAVGSDRGLVGDVLPTPKMTNNTPVTAATAETAAAISPTLQ
ncbi:hypothetical protein ADK34_29785 [Streptomyces viridochromogenes]|uniref:Uncharacterized protein n=1 Tax=Streptomyces viridochromogenes TaxID=1938 RepID=A0A0L8JK14_STRVR|nr:hypothetical protein ADK34_29785 [Streptomyces viridochromogenes]